jgi:hypothetical protein
MKSIVSSSISACPPVIAVDFRNYFFPPFPASI